MGNKGVRLSPSQISPEAWKCRSWRPEHFRQLVWEAVADAAGGVAASCPVLTTYQALAMKQQAPSLFTCSGEPGD